MKIEITYPLGHDTTGEVRVTGMTYRELLVLMNNIKYGEEIPMITDLRQFRAEAISTDAQAFKRMMEEEAAE